MVRNTALPLDGIKVLDLTHVIAGPYCASILSDFGAEIIKIEPPEKGERSRRIIPMIKRNGKQMSGLFATLNRNRKGVVINLKTKEGKNIFKKLVMATDILLENFSPGTMEKLGLGYEALRKINPSLIYVAVSGYGQLEPYTGPYTNWGANNAAIQAMSGLMEISGDTNGPPAILGATLGDTIPGLWSVISTLLALEHRRNTGIGQFVDVSMYDCLASMCFKSVTDYHITGIPPIREEPWHTTFTTRLKCMDGYIAVSLWGGTKEPWERLFSRIGFSEVLSHPDFNFIYPGHPDSYEIVKKTLENWLVNIGKWDAVKILLSFGFTAGVVQNAKDIYDCPQLEKRDLFIELEDGIGGTIRTVGSPIKFSNMSIRKANPPHLLGQDNDEVFSKLSSEAIEWN